MNDGGPVSALLWFRAGREHEAAVARALAAVRTAIAPAAASRFGHRHEEDRPYRTWMIDAGPVPAAQYPALAERLRAACTRSGLEALADGPMRLETFEWLDAAPSDHRCA